MARAKPRQVELENELSYVRRELALWKEMALVTLNNEQPDIIVRAAGWEHKIWHTSASHGGWISYTHESHNATSIYPTLIYVDDMQQVAAGGDVIANIVMAEIRKIRGY